MEVSCSMGCKRLLASRDVHPSLRLTLLLMLEFEVIHSHLSDKSIWLFHHLQKRSFLTKSIRKKLCILSSCLIWSEVELSRFQFLQRICLGGSS